MGAYKTLIKNPRGKTKNRTEALLPLYTKYTTKLGRGELGVASRSYAAWRPWMKSHTEHFPLISDSTDWGCILLDCRTRAHVLRLALQAALATPTHARIHDTPKRTDLCLLFGPQSTPRYRAKHCGCSVVYIGPLCGRGLVWKPLRTPGGDCTRPTWSSRTSTGTIRESPEARLRNMGTD